jgi:hypothetical protein
MSWFKDLDLLTKATALEFAKNMADRFVIAVVQGANIRVPKNWIVPEFSELVLSRIKRYDYYKIIIVDEIEELITVSVERDYLYRGKDEKEWPKD